MSTCGRFCCRSVRWERQLGVAPSWSLSCYASVEVEALNATRLTAHRQRDLLFTPRLGRSTVAAVRRG